MAKASKLNDIIINSISELDEKEKKEVFDFIQYLKIKENRSFIEYVNHRTKEASEAKKRGEKFVSLKELQGEYA